MSVVNNVLKYVDEYGKSAMSGLQKMQGSPIGTELPTPKEAISVVHRVSKLPPDLQERFYAAAVERIGPERVLKVLGEK